MPRFSVIITAYNRKKYILYAVQSILNQSFPREQVEVIVVKNFRDDVIDEFLTGNEIISYYETSIFWNRTIQEAIGAAKGEIISFLDDDDYFSPKKLEVIDRIFSSGEIVFCKDSIIPVEESGKIKENYKDDRDELDYFYLDDIGEFHGKKGFLSFFNSSSMTIYGEVFKARLEILNKESEEEGCRYAMDNFICFTGVESGKCVVIPEKLTYYRHHADQLTLGEINLTDYNEKKIALEAAYNTSYSIMLKAFKSQVIREKLATMQIQSGLQVLLLSPDHVKSLPLQIRSALIDYFRNYDAFTLVLLFMYYISLFSKKMAINIYRILLSRVQRKLN